MDSKAISASHTMSGGAFGSHISQTIGPMLMSRGLRFVVGLLLPVALAGAVLALGAPSAWARAGGGETYGGGGGGSGGGGGGGDDAIGWLIYILIRLVFEYPAVGVPLLIVVIVCLVYASKSTR